MIYSWLSVIGLFIACRSLPPPRAYLESDKIPIFYESHGTSIVEARAALPLDGGVKSSLKEVNENE